ncbi:MAG: glycosyltransferase family 4 protein [Mycobacteriaceae bacterium]
MQEVLLLCWRDTGHPQGGGSEKYLEQVGAVLAGRGIKVTLRTARYDRAPRHEVVNGIHVSRGGGRFTVYPRALLAIAAARCGFGPLKGIKPEAIIDTQNGIPFFAKWVASAPVTILLHHCHREQWPVAGKWAGRIGWWIESKLSPWVHQKNQYLTVSLPSAEEIVALGVNPDHIAVVRAGADAIPREVTPGGEATRSENPTLVVLSRLVPHKQIEDALYVVACLKERIPGLHLEIIGDGWWSKKLRERTAELNISDQVTFHGHVAELVKHQVLSQSWVHLMPSQKEGWGLAVIEAAQHGVPTIGYSSSRGLTDSIIDGVTGLLVENSDELISSSEKLLCNSEVRMQLGEKARIRAADFSWEQCAAGVAEVLNGTSVGLHTSGLQGSPPS